ncbi:MAG: VWA domain-containing protein [Pirellulales bacterium]|nr:VWA domain-containing protein [Pirellulales bacterium]
MTTVRFIGDLPFWIGALAALAAGFLVWRYYRRESVGLPGRLRWMLPWLRAAAFFLAVLVLTGPVLHHRQVIGQLGRVLILIDASRSMAAADRHMPADRKLSIARQEGWIPPGQVEAGSPAVRSALEMFDRTTRWQRAESSLADPSSGLVAALAPNHEVELSAVSGSTVERFWDRHVSEKPPAEFGREPIGSVTDLGSGLGAATAEPSGGEAKTAVVMLTDGRHNFGPSPLEAARLLGGRNVPIYTVGFGDAREPPDLALAGVEHPDLVFQKDRIRGVLVLRDQMLQGQPFVVEIRHEDKVLWQERLTSQGTSPRRVEFEFSIDELADRLRTRLDPEVRHYALPLALVASIVPLEGETDAANNQRTFRFSAITRGNKLLLIDGRARWETRYLRNVFQRDEQWHIDTVLVGPATDQAVLPRGEGADRFPADEAALFDYDLVIFGEVPPGVLGDQEQLWLRNFVERRGGGILFIDGLRGCLRALESGPMGPLLPVTWLPGSLQSPATRLQLTQAGASLSAMALQSSSTANESFWKELPAPHRIVPVQAAPGTEVLVEAMVDGKAYPAMLARWFGAGRVCYCAFDETWRWRYKAADTYHQRFWNQLAKWMMQRPFAVSDRFVSLDSGPPSYAAGETAEIRVRLQGVDGRPASDAMVDAILWRDGRIVATVSLTPEGNGNGIYRGRTAPLAEGEYEVSVRAAGFSSDALKARTRFVVLAPETGETDQIACNEDLLRQVALASGGRFLREDEIGELPELLRPLSTGEVIQSDTLLWQSPWWFAAIIGLLTVEWTLRKRAGLL